MNNAHSVASSSSRLLSDLLSQVALVAAVFAALGAAVISMSGS